MMATLHAIRKVELGNAVLLVEDLIGDVKPKNGTDYKLQELYDLLGVEMIEIVNLQDGTILVIDEEGKLNGQPMNAAATEIFQKAFPGIRDWIVGPALHCRDEEVI